MFIKDTKKLRKLVTDAHIQLKNARSLEERLAIANYLGNLYSSIICMGDVNFKFNKNHSFGGGKKRYDEIMGGLDEYSDAFILDFLHNKKFHNAYFGEILPEYEEELVDLGSLTFDEDPKLSRKDFLAILSEFMNSLGQKDLFDKYYSGHIYSSVIGQSEGNLGFTLYNPISKDTDLFVRKLQYDINSLNTLVHEIGHGFDLSVLDDGIESYNRYFYLSVFGEVISKLYERLLFRFLVKNNICANSAKDKYVDFSIISHDYFLMTYLLSSLEDILLKSDKYIDCDSEYLASKVEEFVLDKKDIIEFFDRMGEIDLSESLSYAYGDVISLFLCDDVEKAGFTSDSFRDFLKERADFFNPDYLKRNGFGPKEYIKLYKDECRFVKK